MSSLADELLNDLDHGPEEVEEEQELKPEFAVPANPRKRKADDDDEMSADEDEAEEEPTADMEGGLAPGGIPAAREMDVEEVESMDLGGIEDVRNVAKLEGSRKMTDTLQVSSIRVPL